MISVHLRKSAANLSVLLRVSVVDVPALASERQNNHPAAVSNLFAFASY
jgi:hypothetical protein